MNEGDYAIVADPDIRDMYIAECLEGVQNSLVTNPVFRVLYMLRYPMQRTISYADVAHENPPIMPDTPCRLKIIREANRNDIALALSGKYEESRLKALETELSQAEVRHHFAEDHPGNRHMKVDPEELAILKRHVKGDVRGTRSALMQRR